MRTESRFGPVEVTSVQHPEHFPENGGLATLGPGNEGYSQLTVVPCLVNGFTPRVGRRW